MNNAKYISINGSILPANKPSIMHNNRGFINADCFHIDLRGNSSKVFFFEKYYNYIVHIINIYKFKMSKIFNKDILETDIELLLQKNRIYQGFKARLSFFRNSDSDNNNSFSYLIAVEPLPDQFFVTPPKGLVLDVFDGFYLPDNIDDLLLMNYNTFEKSFQKIINNELQNTDNYFLLNSNNATLRAIDAELLFVKNGKIISPQTKYYSSNTIIKDVLTHSAEKFNFSFEISEIQVSDLKEMDEILLINSVSGVKWTSAYSEYRYLDKKCEKLTEILNKRVLNL